MGVYPTLYSFTAIFPMLTEWLSYLFIQQIDAWHVLGSQNGMINKTVIYGSHLFRRGFWWRHT